MKEKQWFLYIVDHHEGPYSKDEIERLVKNGGAKTSSYVWCDGLADWMMMSDVPEFGSLKATQDAHGPISFITNASGAKKNNDINLQQIVAQPETVLQIVENKLEYNEIERNEPEVDFKTEIESIDPKSKVWCLSAKQKFSGPYSLEEIQKKIKKKQIKSTDALWREGWSAFVSLATFPQLIENKKSITTNLTQQNTIHVPKAKKRILNSKIFYLLFLATLGAGMYAYFPSTTLDFLNKVRSFTGEISLSQLSYLKKIPLPKFLLPVQDWVFPVHLPEGVSDFDAALVREVVRSPISEGVQLASVLMGGDLTNPSFLLASNLPKNTELTAVLRGRPNTLVNAQSFEQSFQIVFDQQIIRTPRFYYTNQSPLPKGEYALSIYDHSGSQEPLKVFEFFLGGKRDAAYFQDIKSGTTRTESVQPKVSEEMLNLEQTTSTLNAIANESASKFFALIMNDKMSSQRLKIWSSYHKDYLKISNQIKDFLKEARGSKNLEFKNIYDSLQRTHILSEKLHTQQTEYIQKVGTRKLLPKNGPMLQAIRKQAMETANALKNTKKFFKGNE